ncbi:hypothetical protein D3880_12200 [Pseudomonas cavernae]|uniref:AMP-binding enzyme C-terminal domain-containing protein n=1 Tax=Pseudomonas cavernae TaxID=2320867 RepID=A0A385Z1J2_9PSED|nr:hypothetical protein [Pseudomonas cavernae]AYC33079.1 hypothetical protein D3880_12200 [Pseudomonas cavernae]
MQLRQGSQVGVDELQQYAFEHIAERPACPKRIFQVEALPVTAVGKIFKQRLRELAAASVFGERAAPRCGQLAAEVSQQADGSLLLNPDGVPPAHLHWCTEQAERLGLCVQTPEEVTL